MPVTGHKVLPAVTFLLLLLADGTRVSKFPNRRYTWQSVQQEGGRNLRTGRWAYR